MPYKDYFDEDPFPDACPDPEGLKPLEALAIMSNWPHAGLNTWEMGFCMNLESNLRAGYWEPTENQLKVLRKGLFARLHDSDPALWDFPPKDEPC